MNTFIIIKSKDKDLLPGEIEIKNNFIEIKPSVTMGKSFKSNDTPEHRKVYFQKCLISIENQIIMGSKLIFPNEFKDQMELFIKRNPYFTINFNENR